VRSGAAGDDFVVRRWRRLAARRWGDLDGRPVFLLHGTPGSRLGVHPDEGDLRRLGVCLITYDRPGYGLSDPKHGRTVADAAADVELIADHYGYDRFLVVGRSGGGPHALACAALLPSRVAGVASLLGLAPFDAEGLDWFDGMNDANREEYGAALRGRSALSTRIYPEVVAIRANPGHLVDRLATEAPLRRPARCCETPTIARSSSRTSPKQSATAWTAGSRTPSRSSGPGGSASNGSAPRR